MKVKELIEKLKEFDPDKDVIISWRGSFFEKLAKNDDFIDVNLWLTFLIKYLDNVDFYSEPSNTVNIVVESEHLEDKI